MSKCTFQGHKTIIEEKPRNITHQTNSECLNQSLIPAWTRLGPARPQLVSSFLIHISPPQPGNLDFNIKKRQRSLSTATVAKLNYTQLISYAELGSTHPAFTTILLDHKKWTRYHLTIGQLNADLNLAQLFPSLFPLPWMLNKRRIYTKIRLETMSTHSHVQNLNVS